jgi:hypothetical protein
VGTRGGRVEFVIDGGASHALERGEEGFFEGS